MPSTKVVNPSCWSNSEVLRWLIDKDQKQFIPAFLQHNVTGALLKQMLSGEVSLTDDSTVLNLRTVASTVAPAVASKEFARHELAFLENLLRVEFALPVPSAAAEQPVNVWKPTTINGWSYEREKDVWARTLTISCERHRAMILQAQLEKQRAFLEVGTLSLSALITFTSAFATASAASADADPTASADADPTAEDADAGKDSQFALVITTLVLVLSFFNTIMAAWSKIFSHERSLKDWDNFFAKHPEKEETPVLGKLQDVLVELGPDPKDRLRSYDEFMEEFDPIFKSIIEWPKLDPKDWRSTLTHIAKYYPEIWDLLFEHYYENVFFFDCLCGHAWGRWWWLSWAKARDCATYLKALNNHCSQGMLERHWKKEYDADVKRTEQVVRLRNANSQKGAASQEGAAERRLTDAPPGQGQRDSES